MSRTLLPRDDFDAFLTQDYDWIVGLDEAGAGCLAGPLHVGAFALPRNEFYQNLVELPEPVRDSKKIQEAQREKSFNFIQSLGEGAQARIQSVSVSYVEEKNIYWARMETFLDLVIELDDQFKGRALFVVDGNRLHVSPKRLSNKNFAQRWKDLEAKVYAYPKADGTYFCVAAASLLAKVSRDRVMAQLSEAFPQYNWKKNKGYSTPDHMALVSEYGLSPHHRPSFCKNIIFKEKRLPGLGHSLQGSEGESRAREITT
jgi:ribonuclease HII